MWFKRTFLIVLLILILVPFSASAFSLKSLFFWLDDQAPQQTQQVELSEVQKQQAVNKVQAWERAYENKDLDVVLRNNQNLVVSEQELNYLIKQQLDKYGDKVPVREMEVNFSDQAINLEGYIYEPLSGLVDLTVRPVSLGDKIYLHVSQAKFKGFYFPKFLASKLLGKYAQPGLDFLYTHPNYETIDVNIDDNRLQLEYK